MKKPKIFVSFILSLVMLMVISGCQTISPMRIDDKTKPARTKNKTGKTQSVAPTAQNEESREAYAEELFSAHETEGNSGIARYYAKRFSGRRTSSGEIYDAKKLTAAHSSLAFGTRVKIINVANNKSVIVKINDRSREHEESFIDLSRQAARKLGFLRSGKANVRIIIIEDSVSDRYLAEVRD